MAKRKSKRKPKLQPVLEWKRAKRDETDVAKRRTWESRCFRYKVQESVGKLVEMGTIYYALAADKYGFRILSLHRKRKPAEMACEKHNVLHHG